MLLNMQWPLGTVQAFDINVVELHAGSTRYWTIYMYFSPDIELISIFGNVSQILVYILKVIKTIATQ